MGMFDRIWIICPGCGNRIEAQSKAGECTLMDYTIFDAPSNILGDLHDDLIHCDKCKSTWKIQVQTLVNIVPN